MSDQLAINAGNFTVFPGAHTSTSWEKYPYMKKNNTLPNVGEPLQLQLFAGDVVFAHVLLPHRGGRNVYRHGPPPCNYKRPVPWGTREMVYFRLKAFGVDYESKERSNLILSDPWSEYPMIKSYILPENSLLQNQPSDKNCVVEVEAGLS